MIGLGSVAWVTASISPESSLSPGEGRGGDSQRLVPIRLVAGVTYSVTFRSVDVVHGISSILVLGIAHRDIVPGEDYVVTIAPTAAQRGTYTFACTRVCGVGHGGMFGRIEID